MGDLAKLRLTDHPRSRGAGCLLRRLRMVGGCDRANSEVRHDDQVPTGYPVQSPYVAMANRQAEIMMRIASEFGFTPASRSRMPHHPCPNQRYLMIWMQEVKWMRQLRTHR